MKKIFYFILLLNLCQSCSKVLVLNNRIFVDDDPFKMNILHFTNDSICVYEQRFFCEMSEKYKDTKIICRYQVDKNSIILKNITLHKDSLYTPCFKLPETEIKKCSFLNEELVVQKPLLPGAPKAITKVDIYGYINNITTDTLYYKKKSIHYNKWLECAPHPAFTSIKFYEKNDTALRKP